MVRLMKSSLVEKGALYRVTIPKKDFINEGPEVGFNFKIIDDQITFVTTKDNLRSLLDKYPNLIYSRRFVHLWKSKVIPKIISIIFIVLIMILFLSSNSLIREISFKNEELHDEKVYDFVYERLRKIGPFYFLKDGINDLSEELRQKFIDYAWVGLERRGGRIIIDLEQQEVGEEIGDDLSISGNLVASKDGYIKGYLIERGVNLISISQSVKKGQLLVSGNLKYHNPGEEQWTKAKGLVLADTVEYITKTIPKEKSVVEFNGKTTSRLQFVIFGKNINTRKNPYAESNIESSEIFNIGFIKLSREIIKEKQTIKTVYNKENALEYAISIIHKDFKKEHKHPKEKITNIELIYHSESEEKYIFTFIVQKTENIAIFVRR